MFCVQTVRHFAAGGLNFENVLKRLRKIRHKVFILLRGRVSREMEGLGASMRLFLRS
jgi:hypothetical protein